MALVLSQSMKFRGGGRPPVAPLFDLLQNGEQFPENWWNAPDIAVLSTGAEKWLDYCTENKAINT